MKQPWSLRRGSRVLILAPHPDDESLATGGLLQQVAAAGAESRVIFLTNGENNPWPQRVIEWRWQIKATDRERWGTRRRLEALAALSELGVSERATAFWGFPDQGLTHLLLAADDELPQRLVRELVDWQPTVLVTPSPLDLHPDHSASAVFVRLAMARLGMGCSGPQHVEYRVHGRGPNCTTPCFTLALSREQQERKRRAILCHVSQLKLQPSFPKLARAMEEFVSPEEIRDLRHHPVKQASVAGGEMELDLTLSPCPGAFGRATLCLVSHLKGYARAGLSLTLPWLGKNAVIDIWDVVQGRVVAQARFWGEHRRAKLRIPLSVLASTDFVFTKVEHRFGFFDEAGWCELPISKIN